MTFLNSAFCIVLLSLTLITIPLIHILKGSTGITICHISIYNIIYVVCTYNVIYTYMLKRVRILVNISQLYPATTLILPSSQEENNLGLNT